MILRILICFLLIQYSIVLGETIIMIPTPSPTPEDYESVISSLTHLSQVNFDDSIEKTKLKNTETNNVILLMELNPLEKSIFVLTLAEENTKIMLSLQKAWQKELEKFDSKSYKPIPRPEIKNQKQHPALKEDVKLYVKKLLDIRKEYAKKYEDYLTKWNQDFSKELDEKERFLLLNDVKKIHNEEKLIER